jgi:hypothetical protein
MMSLAAACRSLSGARAPRSRSSGGGRRDRHRARTAIIQASRASRPIINRRNSDCAVRATNSAGGEQPVEQLATLCRAMDPPEAVLLEPATRSATHWPSCRPHSRKNFTVGARGGAYREFGTPRPVTLPISHSIAAHRFCGTDRRFD